MAGKKKKKQSLLELHSEALQTADCRLQTEHHLILPIYYVFEKYNYRMYQTCNKIGDIYLVYFMSTIKSEYYTFTYIMYIKSILAVIYVNKPFSETD